MCMYRHQKVANAKRHSVYVFVRVIFALRSCHSEVPRNCFHESNCKHSATAQFGFVFPTAHSSKGIVNYVSMYRVDAIVLIYWNWQSSYYEEKLLKFVKYCIAIFILMILSHYQ